MMVRTKSIIVALACLCENIYHACDDNKRLTKSIVNLIYDDGKKVDIYDIMM
jgi:hypothetical protein